MSRRALSAIIREERPQGHARGHAGEPAMPLARCASRARLDELHEREAEPVAPEPAEKRAPERWSTACPLGTISGSAARASPNCRMLRPEAGSQKEPSATRSIAAASQSPRGSPE